MKTETPITNAIAKIILDELAAVKNNNEYKVAVTGMTHRLLKLCQSLEKDADMRLEWIAREIQQMPDMGGGKPYEWEKLDERDKDNWRMRADEAARRMASNADISDPAGNGRGA